METVACKGAGVHCFLHDLVFDWVHACPLAVSAANQDFARVLEGKSKNARPSLAFRFLPWTVVFPRLNSGQVDLSLACLSRHHSYTISFSHVHFHHHLLGIGGHILFCLSDAFPHNSWYYLSSRGPTQLYIATTSKAQRHIS